MKNLFFIIATFVTISGNAQTAVYHPFPDSNAIWNIQDYYQCWLSPYNYVGQFYSITFANDTTIGTQSYHKLTIPFFQTVASSCVSGSINLNVYKGSIRQDTTNKKVFIVPPSSITEELLYDFTMQVGDTVRGYLESNASPRDIVQSIDSVLVGSTYRKKWNINSGYNISFIEGIGSTYGLLELSPGCITDQLEYSITCFQQNFQTLYPDTTSNCQLIDAVNSEEIISDQVKAFPNPCNGSITIDFGKMESREIILTDLLGHLIFQEKIINQSQFKIDNLQRGSYILTIIDKTNNTAVRKKISCT
jgi:hypothetical protein